MTAPEATGQEASAQEVPENPKKEPKKPSILVRMTSEPISNFFVVACLGLGAAVIATAGHLMLSSLWGATKGFFAGIWSAVRDGFLGFGEIPSLQSLATTALYGGTSVVGAALGLTLAGRIMPFATISSRYSIEKLSKESKEAEAGNYEQAIDVNMKTPSEKLDEAREHLKIEKGMIAATGSAICAIAAIIVTYKYIEPALFSRPTTERQVEPNPSAEAPRQQGAFLPPALRLRENVRLA